MKRMTEMRRWLAILLTVLLIAGALPYTALAEEAAAPEEHAGTMQWYSTAGSGKWIQDDYYYSDAWFQEDPAMQNDSLALLSMQLTAAAVNGDENGPGASLLRELGFTKVGFSRMTSADPDDCSYTWGTKTIQENGEPCTLAVIAVQSFSEDQGLKSKAWRQNFTVNVADGSLIGASGDHAAFSRAADAVIDDIAALGGSGKVRYWITGHSRGGALAGLLAARLPQKLGSRSKGIYAYTFESPAVTDAAMAAAAQENCSYIHNYLCSDDLVAMVPPWGRERYGAICQMKTDEIDARLKKELKKLGSPAAKMDLMNTHEKKARELMTKLTETIPARADYSRRQTDVYQDENGQQKSITYVYQDAFCHLSDAVLSGSFGNLPTDQIFEHLEELAPVVEKTATWWPLALAVLFWAGVAFVLVRVAVSVLSIIKLVRAGETVGEEEGCKIVVTDRDVVPFSWMRYIVLSRKDWEGDCASILAHEKAHVAYGHSVELLLVDVLSALQWFNPAIWMLRADLQELHEYEADDAVLRGGAGLRDYQYLLIRKAVGKSGYTVANNLNHSMLKNRITMMSKTRSDRLRPVGQG